MKRRENTGGFATVAGHRIRLPFGSSFGRDARLAALSFDLRSISPCTSPIVVKIVETLRIQAFDRRRPSSNEADFKEQKTVRKRNPAAQPLGMIIKVKPPAKRAKTEPEEKLVSATKAPDADNLKSAEGDSDKSLNVAKTALVSYSDESEDD